MGRKQETGIRTMKRVCSWVLAATAAMAMTTMAKAERPVFAGAEGTNITMSLQDLRHAVACPPFEGAQPYAKLCHERIVAMLKEASTEIEYLAGAAAATRNAPFFTYRLYGSVAVSGSAEEGTESAEVTISLQDEARHEEIARYTSPITTNAADLASWVSVVRSDMRRRVRKMPFECRVIRHPGQRTLTLDRGLSAGLLPGMVFYISSIEEEILDPNTGEVIGRDSPAAHGKIVVFRVNAKTAYARAMEGTLLPMRGRFFAHAF